MHYNIDLQKIADELDFDLEDVEMLMDVFLQGAKESLLALEEAIDQKDLEQIFRSAHAIKGSAANLLLLDISNIAKEIEHSAREKESIEYNQIFKNLKQLIQNI
ncbi:MAG: Hpt domain-containing protein [Sulfurimonas sp.]|jgi:HPt (histidine-containing phosphotransfer) domain-containing protein|nr:Hpt domain-containing protein [Sulfurimonas sp.]